MKFAPRLPVTSGPPDAWRDSQLRVEESPGSRNDSLSRGNALLEDLQFGISPQRLGSQLLQRLGARDGNCSEED